MLCRLVFRRDQPSPVHSQPTNRNEFDTAPSSANRRPPATACLCNPLRNGNKDRSARRRFYNAQTACDNLTHTPHPRPRGECHPHAFDLGIPSWTLDTLEARNAENGLTVEELAKAISCTHGRAFDLHGQPQFTASLAMKHDCDPEDCMVIGRNAVDATLSPTECVSFDVAVRQFHASGMSSEDILELLKRN